MMESGKMVLKMDPVNNNGLMDQFMRGNGFKINHQEKES